MFLSKNNLAQQAEITKLQKLNSRKKVQNKIETLLPIFWDSKKLQKSENLQFFQKILWRFSGEDSLKTHFENINLEAWLKGVETLFWNIHKREFWRFWSVRFSCFSPKERHQKMFVFVLVIFTWSFSVFMRVHSNSISKSIRNLKPEFSCNFGKAVLFCKKIPIYVEKLVQPLLSKKLFKLVIICPKLRRQVWSENASHQSVRCFKLFVADL